MRTPEQIREAVVQSWIESARDDLAWAEMGASTTSLRGIAQIGFHAQQAVEKLLKGVLASYDVVPEEHHDVARLMAQVRLLDRSAADSLPPVAHLTRYAAQYRYPPRPGRTHGLVRSDVLADLQVARDACRLLEATLTQRLARVRATET
ncbi:MAG TPA: HEPN domain-containing protein [Longimicrobiaceae bacterium]|nr:HEPN domain-containing protein [Longimicrobiaceae bacterium]